MCAARGRIRDRQALARDQLASVAALGADPADCLALEDSETGARAALAAGMQLIAVPSIPGQDPVAPRRLDSLEDPVLADWISTWEARR